MKPQALIVGGTSGIGFGAAAALAGDHDLILVYQSDDLRAEAARAQLTARENAPHVRLIRQPLVNAESVRQLFAQMQECPPQVLINSFGGRNDRLFLTQSAAEIETTLTQHLLLPTLLAQLFGAEMYRAGFGRILNIGSISGHYVKRGQVAYAAAKAGLEGLTRALALELAPRGVTVNLILPGLIETPGTAQHLKDLDARFPKRGHVVPAGRWGQPADVGSLIRFLCLKQSEFITGSQFTIDGGRSLGDARI